MAIFGTRLWLIILGVVVVGAFSLVADDLNDWFHRRVSAEYPKTNLKTNSAAQTADQHRRRTGRRMAARQTSQRSRPMWRLQDQAPAASGQGGDDQSAKRASLAELRAETPGQPVDRAPSETNRQEAAANVGPAVDGGAAQAAARTTNLTVQDQAAPADRQVAQADPSADATREQAGAVAHAPAEKPAIADAEQPADATAGAGASARSNDTASEQTASQSGQHSEPAQKDVTAQASSQPLDQAPAEAPGRDAVANADAQAGSANADAAARSNDAASEQTASQSGQNSEPSQKDVTAQAPSQPLDQAPAEAPGRDAVANADAQAGGANAHIDAKSNDAASEQTATLRGQHSEPAQKDVTAQAPSQPLDQAPAEAPVRDAVANADAQAGGANAHIDAKSNDKASEQTATVRGQHSEPAQKDVTAQAPSQPLDDAASEVAGRGQTGTDPRLQPEICGRLDGAQRQQCVDRLPQLEPHAVVLQAIGGDRWVISETTSPVDYSPAGHRVDCARSRVHQA